MVRTWMPTTAGILSIIAGSLSLLGGLLGAIIASFILISPDFLYGPDTGSFPVFVWILFLPYLIICAVAIAGGIYAMRRQFWGMALAGAICAILTGWAWPLGVAAVVFVASSRHEFGYLPPGVPPGTAPPSGS